MIPDVTPNGVFYLPPTGWLTSFYNPPFRNFCVNAKELEMQDGRTAIFLNTKGCRNDVSKDLQNFLHYVDNKDVKNDRYVDELQDYIGQLSRNRK